MLKITAVIEHGNQITRDHRNEIMEADLDRVKREIRRNAPTGSTINWDIKTW